MTNEMLFKLAMTADGQFAATPAPNAKLGEDDVLTAADVRQGYISARLCQLTRDAERSDISLPDMQRELLSLAAYVGEASPCSGC